MTLSYVFITLTVVALVAWATLAAFTSGPSRTAAPGTTTAAAPPGPTVEPAAIATLLPGLDDLKTITDDQNLEAGPDVGPCRPIRRGWRARPSGVLGKHRRRGPRTPTPPTPSCGYHAAKFSDTRSLLKSVEVLQAVIGISRSAGGPIATGECCCPDGANAAARP